MFDRLSQAIVTYGRAISLLLLLVPSAFSSATYTVTALTQLPSSAQVDNLNNDNQIAGSYYNGTTYAAFEADALTFTPESVPVAGVLFDAVINDNGVLGGTTSSQSFIGSSAVPAAGYQNIYGYALNDSLELAGQVYSSGSGYVAAIMTTSGPSVQASGESFFAINNAGIATGENSSDQMIYGNTAGVTSVPLLAGFNLMQGYGINSSGNICGLGVLSGSGYTQGFYFNGTSSVAIPLPNGDTEAALTNPGCINDSNQVVGSSYIYGGPYEGFLWDPVDGTQLLNNLVPPGWTITNAYYINDNGAILAQGTNGTYTGYVLLTTPEPSTLWLTGALMLSIVLRVRRRTLLRMSPFQPATQPGSRQCPVLVRQPRRDL